MQYKEIHIKNPITTKSVDQLIDDIKACNTSLLILNIGEHNFESVEVMKELKNRLTTEIRSQIHIRKIAFLIPDVIAANPDETLKPGSPRWIVDLIICLQRLCA